MEIKRVDLIKPVETGCKKFDDNVGRFLNIINGVISAVELYEEAKDYLSKD